LAKVSRITRVFGGSRQKTSKRSEPASEPSLSPRAPPSPIHSSDSDGVDVASGTEVRFSSSGKKYEQSVRGVGMEPAFPSAPDDLATLHTLHAVWSRVLDGQATLHDRLGRLEERLEQVTLPGRSDTCTKRLSVAESKHSNKHAAIKRERLDTLRRGSRSPRKRYTVYAESPLLIAGPESLQVSFDHRGPATSRSSAGTSSPGSRWTSALDRLRGSAIPSCPIGADGLAKLCGSSL